MSSIVLALVLAIFVAVTLILVVGLVFLITNRRKLDDYIQPSDTWYRTLLRSSRGRGSSARKVNRRPCQPDPDGPLASTSFEVTVHTMRLGKRGNDEGVLDPSKVDVVSMAADDTVELGLVQTHPWTGSDAQLQSFQQKVQTYVSYAADGGMAATYPETEGRPWRIVVHSQAGAPDASTAHVISVLAQRLPKYGGTIEMR